MKMHHFEEGLKEDQAMAFKALAAEVMEEGYHFFILLHLVDWPPELLAVLSMEDVHHIVCAGC